VAGSLGHALKTRLLLLRLSGCPALNCRLSRKKLVNSSLQARLWISAARYCMSPHTITRRRRVSAVASFMTLSTRSVIRPTARHSPMVPPRRRCSVALSSGFISCPIWEESVRNCTEPHIAVCSKRLTFITGSAVSNRPDRAYALPSGGLNARCRLRLPNCGSAPPGFSCPQRGRVQAKPRQWSSEVGVIPAASWRPSPCNPERAS